MNRKPDPDKLARVISESAHQIWSAGLDALSLAEKESSKFFESLSQLSGNIQSQTQKTADVAKKTVTGGKTTATDTWDKLEEMFELRVGRALNALQIPTAKDIKELSARVDKLSKAVDELSARQTADRKEGTKKKRKKAAATKKRKKAAAKKTTRKKTTRRKKSKV
ncbi:MAG: phasin family protein [Gammaproteobacteria bacterium]|nr:phasin family protein [Gammaproteobacteria bacterium]MDH3767278.1 phasin family protein [Gammaproteobacteria bacterium]